MSKKPALWALRWFVSVAGMIAIFCCVGSASQPVGAAPASRMRPIIEHFRADRRSLLKKYALPIAPERATRMKRFYDDELQTLAKLDFDALNQEDRVDYLLLKNHVNSELHQLSIVGKQIDEMKPLLPFAGTIIGLDDSLRRMAPCDPQKEAGQLTEMVRTIAQVRKAEEEGLSVSAKGNAQSGQVAPIRVNKIVANRAVFAVQSLQRALKRQFDFYNGYDPQFTWWVAEPYKQADQALGDYANFLKEKLVGISADDKTTIIGDPVGREALMAELADNMIPYTPEQLISIAKTEMAWSMREMLKASREMGYGDDWHKALEHVKTMHVAPGGQPALIRKLALEGIDFAEKNDLVTIPALAKETWRMDMMSPQRQLVNPFFTGGDIISVSFPTDTMTYDQRMMSMRGNNIPFARATVFHELIPGHYLQEYMTDRYRNYRQVFATPFWSEGNAFYWEMIYWDKGFATTPEERVGMLFWRLHRSARIIFTMSFHLGLWTPKQCVDFLINSVGHEPDNATAEVRRSFDGSVGPLYQCAYMVGALQFRALHKELVDSGKMTNRQFHDAILHENEMPIEMLRAILTGQKLTKDYTTQWKFYGPVAGTN